MQDPKLATLLSDLRNFTETLEDSGDFGFIMAEELRGYLDAYTSETEPMILPDDFLGFPRSI